MAEGPVHLYAAPVKHSVTIAGHRTSISLEPVFWEALRDAAGRRGCTLTMLVADIDEARMAGLKDASAPPPPNLASAIRCWLWAHYRP